MSANGSAPRRRGSPVEEESTRECPLNVSSRAEVGHLAGSAEGSGLTQMLIQDRQHDIDECPFRGGLPSGWSLRGLDESLSDRATGRIAQLSQVSRPFRYGLGGVSTGKSPAFDNNGRTSN
jgi:hypothetical protein